ncbi:hypothetical protein LSH36_1289g00007 [Paralvinella palmiformis]|uniref:Uncharacterized protein n=1 Tax=Paralvinella palmiformis TaxID=53620 RepID=A0AAD9IUQ4_9ANNE|nr:hypothetical protein LSH36_1289g00007 [Paralvinella palmiformis]
MRREMENWIVYGVFSTLAPKDEVSKLVQSKMNGATPLIMASKNGHIGVVEFLVENCGADVETVGSVTFDGENIEGAPPLWCAAAAGHLDVVKFLLKCGAKVNNTTYTNSTPLRAACFDGHFDIVKFLIDNGADIEIANRHGHTSLMISCYKGHYNIVKFLINKGANINRKSLKGNTALHDCAESGSLEIMKLLLQNDAAMEKDSYGMTPLIAAAVTGHTRVVEYLIRREYCAPVQKVEALELLGATYVDKKRDMSGALKYWRMALSERIGENMPEKSSHTSPVAAYENATEFRTEEDLNNIVSDPDAMRMQALLVRERILGPAHPDTSYYIRYRGAVYADIGKFDRCVTLWMYALDMQQKILEPLSPMTQSSFLSFAELFSYMMTESRHKKVHHVSFDDMVTVYRKAVTEMERGNKQMKDSSSTPDKDVASLNRLLIIILHLTSLLCKIESQLSKEERFTFRKMVYDLVKTKPCGLRGYTLLHLACSRNTTTVGRYPVCSFPSADVVRLLLDVAAPVDAVDQDGDTALHVAASNKPCTTEIVRMLLEAGSHHDCCNQEHKTPYQLLSGVGISEISSPLQYVTLQCLAARTIIEEGIQYKGRIPNRMYKFVEMH